MVMIRNWKFESSHFGNKKLAKNVCAGYAGAYYLMDMINFLTLIVENNKLIKEWDIFEQNPCLEF
jgi:hypothetical protein